jgi:hypothetical protein
MGERCASRRVSLAAGLAGCSSTGGFGVSCIVVFVGGVGGVVEVDIALDVAAELVFVVAVGLLTSADGFFFNPLPKGKVFALLESAFELRFLSFVGWYSRILQQAQGSQLLKQQESPDFWSFRSMQNSLLRWMMRMMSWTLNCSFWSVFKISRIFNIAYDTRLLYRSTVEEAIVSFAC